MATQNDNDDDKDGQGAGTESGLRPVTAPPLQGGDDDFEIIETDDAGNVVNTIAPAAPAYTGDEGRMSEDDGGTGPIIPAREGDGDGARREPKSQRNARRRESRERTYQENERLRGEMNELRQRLDNFEGSATSRLTELGEAQIQQQIGRLDTNIANAEAAYRSATAKIADAMSSADNVALMAGLEERDTALVNKTQLTNEKVRVGKMLEDARAGGSAPQGGDQRQPQTRQPTEQQRQAAPPPPARVQQFVRAFSEEHEWFNPNPTANDIDSNTAIMIDRAVAAEGYDPATPDYWAEVNDRLQQRLPHLFDGTNQQTQNGGRQAQQPAPRQQQGQPAPQRRGPPTGGVGDRGPAPSNRPQLKISPARKEAMIQAGAIGSDGSVLDRPKYQRLLKGYADFDRTNQNGR